MSDEVPFRAAPDDRPGWSRVVLSGRVTVAHAAPFRALAAELAGAGTDVCVRCDGAEYLDVSAIQVLLALGREVAAAGRRFDVAGVPAALAEYFRLAGLAQNS